MFWSIADLLQTRKRLTIYIARGMLRLFTWYIFRSTRIATDRQDSLNFAFELVFVLLWWYTALENQLITTIHQEFIV